jgi:anthranilate phosphoribosyltransferase
LDELGISGPSAVTEFDARTGATTTYKIDPREFELTIASVEELRGGGVEENIKITRDILSGENGARRSVTLLNAGAGIYAANAATSIGEGIEIAKASIDSGKALAALDGLVELTRQFTPDLVAV